jgi:hypothetical protein
VILTFLSVAIAFISWVKISEIQKKPKFCKKISKTAKAKMQNYEIERNRMKLSFDIIKYRKISFNHVQHKGSLFWV